MNSPLRARLILAVLTVLAGFALGGCDRTVVTTGMSLADIQAEKGKPLSVVSSGERTIVRWPDVVIRFENQIATRIEIRNREHEEAVRRRCELAIADLAARRAAEEKRAGELRQQAEKDTAAYVLALEQQRKAEAEFAVQEDLRLRQSSFGRMPEVTLSCSSEARERLGLSFPTSSFAASGAQPWRTEVARNLARAVPPVPVIVRRR